jgi:putative transposase
MSRAERRGLVEREAPALPVSRQCRLLAVSRASFYRRPAEISEEDCTIVALIDRQYLARPYYGSRRMAAWLATQGHVVNRKRVRRLMRLAGLVAIYQRPNTSTPAVDHKIYPTCCVGFRSSGSIRSGARMSPTSRWPRALPPNERRGGARTPAPSGPGGGDVIFERPRSFTANERVAGRHVAPTRCRALQGDCEQTARRCPRM